MKNKFVCWCILITLVFIGLPATALAADSGVGVAYRGHIQDRGDYPADGSWVDSPEIIGTTGQSKRIEGFEIKLTGTIPTDLQNGMELRYNVHVQNKGWLYDENDVTDWPKDGAYAGTRGESLRIEAVKIVLTDAAGKAVSGYSVQYRGHVQNLGDLPKAADQWLADGAQLGTVGSSQRLEALLVQVVKNAVEPVEPVEPQDYDTAGSYGPTTGTETIAGDVTVAADGVVLNNLVIEGNLTISEAVGSGTVTLNNVIVKGDTLVRGGGVNSIHINGGSYQKIIMEKTASGAVRIVAVGVDGLAVVIAEDATGETIILEGAFASVTVNAPNMTLTTQGTTTIIDKLTVGAEAAGSTLNLATGTTVADLVLDGTAAVKGQGTVTKAEVNADSVVFEKAPGSYAVESDVVIPPVFPTPDSGGGGGGYTPTQTAVSFSPAGGVVVMGTTVMLGSADATAIYYTTDGSNPSTVSGAPNTTKVIGDSATITVDQALTVKALAARPGYHNSAVVTASYTLPPSADLIGISISPVTANFSFAPDTYNYPNVTVANYVENISITTAGSGNITVNGMAVPSGVTFAIPTQVSYQVETTITVVNQEAGKAPKTYTIKLTPSSGTVTPIVSTLLTPVPVTSTTLDLNNSGIFGIKPGNGGVLSDIEFSSGDDTMIASSLMSDGIIPILKDGTTSMTFEKAMVTLGGINYDNISLNDMTITVTVTTYLTKVNSGTATVEDYAKAGITGVVAENLVGINAAVVAAQTAAGADLDKTAVQTLVDSYLAKANTFAVAFENSDTIIQNEVCDLRFTDAKDGYGNPLTGDRSIVVVSSVEGLSPFLTGKFSNGTALETGSLSKPGDHSLEVNVYGMSSSHDLTATVYSRLEYDANADNIVSGYNAVNNGLNVLIPPDNHGIAVTAIGNTAFISKGLTSVTLPNSLTSIGASAFMFNSLTNLIIPDSVTYLGIQAFASNNLSSVILPENLKKIENYTFIGNPLIRITIGSGVSIDDYDVNAPTMGTHGVAFKAFYDDPVNNNKAGGTFIYSGTAWTKVV